jgi:hypothetical protein
MAASGDLQMTVGTLPPHILLARQPGLIATMPRRQRSGRRLWKWMEIVLGVLLYFMHYNIESVGERRLHLHHQFLMLS